MENSSLTFRESLFMMLLFLLTVAFLACSLALHAIAANLPYIILAGTASVCLITVTAAKSYAMIAEARKPNYYLEDRRDYIEADCREVEPARVKLLGRVRK